MVWWKANLKSSKCFGENRSKMYADLQTLYRKYLDGELGTGSPEDPEQPLEGEPTFAEDFEIGWITESEEELVLKFNETFEIDWFIINIYSINIAIDNFEENWFINNQYTIEIIKEDFEDESWD